MRVLLIEDDERLSKSIPEMLRAAGHAVDVALDGFIGEEYAAVNLYDVIVLDIMLPKQDGWTTCRHLRQSGILTPILMLTALGDVDDRIRGLDTGADDYLTKPFHNGELLARLRSLSRRSTQQRGSTLEVFGLLLDSATHHARRNGRDITLSTKEFALLELFMTHPHTIVSRERISEYLWDMNFEPRSNVIESFVKFLRQKIECNGEPKLIHTIRGAGYMFSDKEP
ncbi:MAG: response regulator transcription factor [Ignavibacteria bacterium]|nr:response regulator transcription factor [Ignavibacteria bacterium]